MSKQEFVEKVAEEAGLSKKDATAAVDAVLKTIEDELKDGGEVSFTGFGTFHVAERGARRRRRRPRRPPRRRRRRPCCGGPRGPPRPRCRRRAPPMPRPRARRRP